jgi:hypothetical protein
MPGPTNSTDRTPPRAEKPPASTLRTKPAATARKAAPTAPSPEQIARRAYEKFLARGQVHGRHEDDWAEAELELRAESASADLYDLRGLS